NRPDALGAIARAGGDVAGRGDHHRSAGGIGVDALGIVALGRDVAGRGDADAVGGGGIDALRVLAAGGDVGEAGDGGCAVGDDGDAFGIVAVGRDRHAGARRGAGLDRQIAVGAAAGDDAARLGAAGGVDDDAVLHHDGKVVDLVFDAVRKSVADGGAGDGAAGCAGAAFIERQRR